MYVIDFAAFLEYVQVVRPRRVHFILRHCATFFPAFRRLSAHGAHTRGNYHQTEIGLLESPSPTKGEICQRDISPPKGRGGMGHRNRAADRSQEPTTTR